MTNDNNQIKISNPACRVVWITGLSGSGKSSIANELAKILKQKEYSVILLDGDDLRYVFNVEKQMTESYSRDSRLQLAIKYSRLCELLAEQNVVSIIATISLFDEIHQRNRKYVNGYVEVFLDIPFSELEKRDPKGLYANFKKGNLTNIAGLDQKVDFPKSPDIQIKSSSDDIKKIAQNLSNWLEENYDLPTPYKGYD